MMTTPTPSPRRAFLVPATINPAAGLAPAALPLAVSALAAILAATGCATRPSAITLDGDVSEWRPDVVAAADEDYLYLRVMLADTRGPLQAAESTVSLWLDVDSDGATGRTPASPSAASGMGVDLEITFSPPQADGTPGRGVAVSRVAADGTVSQAHADVDLVSAPTASGDWYELRVSRNVGHIAGLPAAGLATSGDARGLFVLPGAAGVEGWSDPFAVSMSRARGAAWATSATPPAKPAGALRVMTFNVLDGRPAIDPQPFARVIAAMAPDVILFQEWPGVSADEIRAWLDAHAPTASGWSAVTSDAWGVVVAAAHPSAPFGPSRLGIDEDPSAAPVRVAGARVSTPAGDLVAASVHLTCCGTDGSPEDQRRVAEAGAINRVLAESLAADPAALRIIAGDFNLVGSRTPIDAAAAGLDADGSSLEIVEPMVYGDRVFYTWSDPRSEFSPGRLDFVLVSGSSLRVVQTFVLDANRLTDESLARLGLDRSDTSASDHLPVIVDVEAR